jgi:Zn-dependent M28 family amino/carboxypeptidase
LKAIAVCVFGVAACGDDAMPPVCDRPGDAPAWLDGAIEDAVATLSMSPRSTTAERDATRVYLRDALVDLGYAPEAATYVTGENVIARIDATTGTGAPWIVVGAHFDSVAVSPGANDNATGVAVVLAVARQVREMTCRSRGVIVAFFDEEEIGRVGSFAHARDLFQGGVDVEAVHTIDQVGWDSDGDRVFELELPAPAIETAYGVTAARLGVAVSSTTTATSDHQSFRDRGFAATGISEEYAGGDTTPHYHQAGDTFDTVNLPFTVLGARLVAETVMDQLE